MNNCEAKKKNETNKTYSSVHAIKYTQKHFIQESGDWKLKRTKNNNKCLHPLFSNAKNFAILGPTTIVTLNMNYNVNFLEPTIITANQNATAHDSMDLYSIEKKKIIAKSQEEITIEANWIFALTSARYVCALEQLIYNRRSVWNVTTWRRFFFGVVDFVKCHRCYRWLPWLTMNLNCEWTDEFGWIDVQIKTTSLSIIFKNDFLFCNFHPETCRTEEKISQRTNSSFSVDGIERTHLLAESYFYIENDDHHFDTQFSLVLVRMWKTAEVRCWKL